MGFHYIEHLEKALDKAEKFLADYATLLADPVSVHINMLNGKIAKPAWKDIKHLYAKESAAEDQLRDQLAAALRKAHWLLTIHTEGVGPNDLEQVIYENEAALARYRRTGY